MKEDFELIVTSNAAGVCGNGSKEMGISPISGDFPLLQILTG
jgi:hypothetical protein